MYRKCTQMTFVNLDWQLLQTPNFIETGNYYIKTYGVAMLVFEVIHLSPQPAATRKALITQAGLSPRNKTSSEQAQGSARGALTQGAEILSYIGLREKWKSP